MSLVITPLTGIPLINPGDYLPEIINKTLAPSNIGLIDGDIIVLAQKIVSKAEGRLVNLSTVKPSKNAIESADITGKDPRLIELVLNESKQVLRARPGLIIVEHRLGFVCANAGIDHSNVHGDWGDPDDWYLLLPEDPDASANDIRSWFRYNADIDIGVMIIDSHGRAWRNGTIGMCIGLSGIPGVVNFRGRKDLFGYELRVTEVAAADELAAAASLMMGQAAEGQPAVHVRGFPYPFQEGTLKELLRPREKDLFQ